MRPSRTLLAGALTATLLTTGWSAASATGPATSTLTGTVRVIAVDPPSAVQSQVRTQATSPGTDPGLRTRAVLDVGGRLLDVPPGQDAGLRAGDRVRVATEGDRGSERVLSVQADPAGRARSTGTSLPVTGTHRLTVLPVYWQTPDAATVASLGALATATAEYWSQQSGGRIVITPQVRDWVRIAAPGSCSPSTLANLALAAHQVSLPSSRFDHLLIYFPAWSACGWAGLGQVGGSVIWDNGLELTDVSAHEFGHNLGLGHANTATCSSGGQRVTLLNPPTTCTLSEYRDYADVMGIAMYQPSGNLNSSLADWLGLARTVTAAPGTRTSVDLAPLAQVESTRAVKIRTATGWVYLDYRPATGRDVRMPGWAGVQVHLLPDGSYPQSQLLDGRPTSSAPFSVTALPVGSPWTVPGTDLTVTVSSQSATSARVEVAPATAGAAVPVPVLTGPASGSLIGSSVPVGWRLPAAAAGVRVLVDGQQRAQATASGLTGTVTLSGLTDGRHQLTAQAVDQAGRLGAQSAAVTVTADATAPSVPSGLALSSSEVLSWRASTDTGSGPAGYLLTLDAGAPVRLGLVTSARLSTPAGRHVWWLAAVDRVGNVSAPAGLLVVKSSPTQRTRAVRVAPPAAVSTRPAQTLRGTVRPL